MISGLIIYSKEDIERNQWFIDKCLKELNNELFSLKLVPEQDVTFLNKEIDFIINRSRNFEIAKEAESLRIRCFNNSLTNEIANDKYKTYKLLKNNNIPCLESFLSFSEINEFPLIMKSVDGHGGQEVYLINSQKDADEILKKSHKKFIYQRYIENSGDLRIYILNNKVIGAVLRQNEQDFRSNYSLGGAVQTYEPNEELIGTALKISNLLNADFIGVDFLKTDDGFLANEIEDPVGSRMLYQACNIDAVSLFIDDIKAKLLEK